MESNLTKIRLHHSQGLVWQDKSRYRILVAGRRFGKTTLAINELLQSAIARPNSLNWYVAPTYRQAKMIAWKLLNETIPENLVVKRYEVELRVILNNNSEICLKGADNEDSLRGTGLTFLVLDEFSSCRETIWSEILRPALTDKKGRCLFIGTPKGKNHFWELYIKGKQAKGFQSWLFTSLDNPYIDPEEVAQAEKELPSRYFRQEFLASFEDFTGLVYPEFTKEHIVEPFPLPDHWNKVGAIDPAISGISAVLWGAVDDHDNIYIYNEVYELNKRVSDIAESIIAIDKLPYFYIDPASKIKAQRKMGELYSLFDEYLDNGIVTIPGENDVEAGINRVAEYFKNGTLKIFSTCKNLIWELERYHWAEERETVGGITKAKPFKKHDHNCDALRYMVMSRAGAGKKDTRPEPGIWSPAWFDEQEKLKQHDFETNFV